MTPEEQEIHVAAVEVGIAIAGLQVALSRLERAVEFSEVSLESERFDLVFASTARLAGRMVGDVRTLLEALEVKLQERKP